MSQPFIGEIRMFGGNFAPVGFAFCNGQLLSIADNNALFALIGTTYGGDGQTTFALPNLQGRLPMHMGSGAGTTVTIGEAGGTESVTLSANQIPNHTHALQASTAAGTSAAPANNVLAASSAVKVYKAGTPANALATQAIGNNGGNQPHGNIQPYQCINFIIALEGIFPSRN